MTELDNILDAVPRKRVRGLCEIHTIGFRIDHMEFEQVGKQA